MIPKTRKGKIALVLGLAGGCAAVTGVVAALLVNVFERKQEQRDPYIRLVEIDESTTDPAIWGVNWPREYHSYRRTSETTKTMFGGSDTLPVQKAELDPWLTRMFAGYAFSIDYRDRRGHAYMLYDQENTKRVTQKPQPGACLHCHASIIPTYKMVGIKAGAHPDGAIMKGFELVNAMSYAEAHNLKDAHGKSMVNHPVSCVDCHNPKTMNIRVTRPAFINGIAALKLKEGIPNYDPNKMASPHEMRTFVCAQCHVEYYFEGKSKKVTYPWANGLKVEEIEQYFDTRGIVDWKHAETGAAILKAQHPEFETWSQGIHARSGVSCTDCHMPYVREGSLKVSDHWVRSPLLNINRACQQCHHYPEHEIASRVLNIQQRHRELLNRASKTLISFLDTLKQIRAPIDEIVKQGLVNGAQSKKLSPSELGKKIKEAQDTQWNTNVSKNKYLQDALALHRKAQWRLDFVAAENSMGFHAPQESARILAEAIDYFRQAEIALKNGSPGLLRKPRATFNVVGLRH